MIADSSSVLKDAMVGVRRVLKERGFKSKGTSFHRVVEDGNTVVLSIQKSVKSTPAVTEVTVNYGVYSALIGSKFQDDPSAAQEVMKAHWRKRLSEKGRETWLLVEASDSADNCVRVVIDAAESVLTELLAHSSNAALRDEWLAGVSPGLGNMQRLLFAAILVNEVGPVEKLGDILGELRAVVAGSVHEGLVERQLARAGVQAG